MGLRASRQAPWRRPGRSAPAARRRRRPPPLLVSAAPNPLLPPPPRSAPPVAMASISELLDALPRHFGALAPTDVAAQEAGSVARQMHSLAMECVNDGRVAAIVHEK